MFVPIVHVLFLPPNDEDNELSSFSLLQDTPDKRTQTMVEAGLVAPFIYHPRGNKYILNSWRFSFEVYVFVLNPNSLTNNIFHVYAFVSATRQIPAKTRGMCI